MLHSILRGVIYILYYVIHHIEGYHFHSCGASYWWLFLAFLNVVQYCILRGVIYIPASVYNILRSDFVCAKFYGGNIGKTRRVGGVCCIFGTLASICSVFGGPKGTFLAQWENIQHIVGPQLSRVSITHSWDFWDHHCFAAGSGNNDIRFPQASQGEVRRKLIFHYAYRLLFGFPLLFSSVF
jgi:hypothetical protein